MTHGPRTHHQIAVIGGGPAGMAAALQCTRFDFKPVIFEKKRLGGLLWEANRVENYLGFKSSPGATLVQAFCNHLEHYAVPVRYEEIRSIDYQELTTEGTTTWTGRFLLESEIIQEADLVIIAAGTEPKKGNIPQLATLESDVLYEIAPIRTEKGKHIVIIGAGDIAFDYALQLAPTNEITILHRGRTIKALPLLQRRLKQYKNIRFHPSCRLEEVKKNGPDSFEINYHDGTHQRLIADYILTAVGRRPQCPVLKPGLKSKESQLLEAGRLHYCGDIKNGRNRQAAIAAGNGIEAAMRIHDLFHDVLSETA